MAVVVCLCAGFSWQRAHHPHSASISGTVERGSGHMVTVPIVISTDGRHINAAQIKLNFDPTKFTVKSVSKTGSIFKLWVTNEPKFSNTTGIITFAGGIATPGFVGTGKVGSVVLESTHPASGELRFSDTELLLNDGLGTPVPLSLPPIEVKIP